jgi:serine/threonine protein kinase
MSRSTILRFEVLRELGGNGRGTVYKALDPATQRTVAIREIRPEALTPEARVRLPEQLKAALTLDSPNIVRILEVALQDPSWYVVTEYVEGVILQALMQQTSAFSEWDLVDMTRQVCFAIDHAHARGLAHSNLHPGNILQEWDGNIRLMDYGLGTHPQPLAGPGSRPVVLPYLSPEQMEGRPPDRRANLFNWGTILYQMAAGSRASAEKTASAFLDELAGPEASGPGSNLGPVPIKVLKKALAKRPEDRYPTGADMVRDWELSRQPNQETVVVPVAPPKPRKAAEDLLSLQASGSPETAKAASTRFAASPLPRPATTPVLSTAPPPKPPVNPPMAAPPKPPLSPPMAPPPKLSPSPVPAPEATSPVMPGKVGSSNVVDHAPAVPPLKATVVPTASDSAPAWQAETPPEPGRAGFIVVSSRATVTPAPPVPSPAASRRPSIRPASSAQGEQALQEVRSSLVRAGQEISRSASGLWEIGRRYVLYEVLAATVLVAGLLAGHLLHSTSQSAYQPEPPVESTTLSPVPAPPEPALSPPSVQPQQPPPVSAVEKRGKRQKPVSAPAPAQLATAVLTLETAPPGAQIQLDGNTLGVSTPYVISGLSAGDHIVALAKPGYAVERRLVQIRPGERFTVSVSLNELGAILAVSSKPQGASIFLDGRDTGRLTPATLNVPKGQYRVTVAQNGFFDATYALECASGQRCEFSPQLTPKGHAEEVKPVGKLKRLFGGSPAIGSEVQIRTTPKGAQILVNQRPLGKATPAEFIFPAGTYEITLTLPGYKPAHRIVTLAGAGKNSVEEVLQKE